MANPPPPREGLVVEMSYYLKKGMIVKWFWIKLEIGILPFILAQAVFIGKHGIERFLPEIWFIKGDVEA